MPSSGDFRGAQRPQVFESFGSPNNQGLSLFEEFYLDGLFPTVSAGARVKITLNNGRFQESRRRFVEVPIA